MIKCRECSAFEPAGALYCGECGALLLETEDEIAGAQLPFTNALIPPSAPTLVGQESDPSLDVQKITFVIPSSGRRVQMEAAQEIRIGRVDPHADHFPELDLSQDEGGAYGVSRFHALIQPSGGGVVIIDRSSTNGTLLNGYHLPPDLPYPLHSGDEVRFGQLLVHIFLE